MVDSSTFKGRQVVKYDVSSRGVMVHLLKGDHIYANRHEVNLPHRRENSIMEPSYETPRKSFLQLSDECRQEGLVGQKTSEDLEVQMQYVLDTVREAPGIHDKISLILRLNDRFMTGIPQAEDVVKKMESSKLIETIAEGWPITYYPAQFSKS